jgi:hypothetical protein
MKQLKQPIFRTCWISTSRNTPPYSIVIEDTSVTACTRTFVQQRRPHARKLDGQTVDSAPPFVDVATNSNSFIVHKNTPSSHQHFLLDDAMARLVEPIARWLYSWELKNNTASSSTSATSTKSWLLLSLAMLLRETQKTEAMD